MKSPIGLAISVFVLAAGLLKYHMSQEWAAPNFVDWSSTFDYVLQLTDASELFDYTHGLDLAAFLHRGYTDSGDTCQSNRSNELKKQKPFHLLHIPTWALSPDRITSQSLSEDESVQRLHDYLDESRDRWQETLGVWTEDFTPVRSTESQMEGAMSNLDGNLRQWVKNVSRPLFNASMMIFSYQMNDFSDEMLWWVQNTGSAFRPSADDVDLISLLLYGDDAVQKPAESSGRQGSGEQGSKSMKQGSTDDLRFHFERTRGWPTLHSGHLVSTVTPQKRTFKGTYQRICEKIGVSKERIEFYDSRMDDSAKDLEQSAIEQCGYFLDRLLPWLPDNSPSLGTMWPSRMDMDPTSDGFDAFAKELTELEGFRSPFTQVITQRMKPTGEPLLYVSPNGTEQIPVEWFHPGGAHLRATNIAFVRRIRNHIKRLTQALDDSISVKEFEDEYGWFYGHEINEHSKRDERFSKEFVQFVEQYNIELMKGQFDRGLRIDLTMNRFPVFLHALPTLPVFNDGGIKRAWTFALGSPVPRKELVLAPITLQSAKPAVRRLVEKVFKLQRFNYQGSSLPDLKFVALWPFALGGYLRAHSPELSRFAYPSIADALRLELPRRVVLIADVLDSIYKPSIRRVLRSRMALDHAESVEYGFTNLTSLLSAEMSLAYDVLALDSHHTRIEQGSRHTLAAMAAVKIATLAQCSRVECAAAGFVYHSFEGFVRDDYPSQMAVMMLEKHGIVRWIREQGRSQDQFAFDWHALTHLEIKEGWENIMDDSELMKQLRSRYSRVFSGELRDKFTVLRRPGEDSFYY